MDDGNDIEAIDAAIECGAKGDWQALPDPRAHDHRIRLADKHGASGAHGSPLGPNETAEAKKNLGWPLAPAFSVPEEAQTLFHEAQ